MQCTYNLVLLLLLFLTFTDITAQTLQTPLSQRIVQSEIIVEGKITASKAFANPINNLIYTEHTVEVYKSFTPTVTDKEIKVTTLGGVLEYRALVACPSLHLEIGQVGILLLKKYQGTLIHPAKNNSAVIPVASELSFIHYTPDLMSARNGSDYFPNLQYVYDEITKVTQHAPDYLQDLSVLATNKNLMPSITNISPLNVSAGTGTVITITGTGFGSTPGSVFFRNADNGGSGFTGTSDVNSWTDTQIELKVPSRAGTGNIIVANSGGQQSSGSAQSLTVNYNIGTVGAAGSPNSYLVDDAADGDGGYKYLYSTNTANNGVDFTANVAAMAAFERAASNWNTQTGFPIYTGESCGTTTIQTTMDDGTNVVFFDNDIYDLDVERGNSVLGVAFSYFGKCGSSNWEITDIDIVFRRDGNPNNTGGSVNWNYGPGNPSNGQSDFESVALHELGHNHQLGHVINNGAVMHWQITNGTTARVLGTNDDIAGGNYEMNISTNYNPPLINCGGDYNSPRQATSYNTANDCGGSGLSVQLLSFSGNSIDKSVVLEWETANEINFSHFLLERSFDGIHFDLIHKVSGGQSNYRSLDNAPINGMNYYRLRQIDVSGHEVISNMIKVPFLNQKRISNIFPNPNHTGILNIAIPQEMKSEIQIYTIDGKQVLRNKFTQTEHQINIKSLVAGIYFIKIVQADRTHTQRLMIH